MKKWLGVFIVLIGMGVFVSLGVWQLGRAQQKEHLIQAYQRSMQKEAVGVTRLRDLAALKDRGLYRRVRLTGRWKGTEERRIGPRVVKGQVGHQVFFLFCLKGSERSDNKERERKLPECLWVQHSWVPDGMSISQTGNLPFSGAVLPVEDKDISIEVRLHVPPQQKWLTPRNQPEKQQWYWPDVVQMAKDVDENVWSAHYGEYLGETLGAEEYKLPAHLEAMLPWQHQCYAYIWFALAVLTGVMWVLLFKQNRNIVRRKRIDE